MNNYNTQTNANTEKQTALLAATILAEHKLIPVPLCRPAPDARKPKDGKEASIGAWNKLETYDGQTIESVKSAFHDAVGVGLLLTNGLAVIDIDARNIANDRGFEVAELFGVDTSHNTLGRKFKTHGAIVVQTAPEMLHYKTPKGECEILCKGDGSTYQQKVLPPSKIYDNKHKEFDSFYWNTQFNPETLQYIEPVTLKKIANFIAAASHLTTYYPNEGLRDDAGLCLMRILFLVEGADSEFVTEFINIVARNANDKERVQKNYHKQFAKLDEVNNPKGQLKKYWSDADADYILKLLGVDTERKKEEEEEVLTPRIRNNFNASDFELEGLPPQDWVMFKMLPRGDLTVFSGDGGTGKTNFLIQQSLMSCVPGAYFTKLAPYGSKSYRTFLMSNEDPTGVLKRRVAVHKKAIRELHPEYEGNFEHFMAESFRDEPIRLVKKKRNGIPEVNHKDIKLLQEIVGDNKIDSLILDPISTLHVGMNENDNADMDFMIRKGIISPLCQKMYINVTAVTHVAKGTNNNDDDIQASSWASRGATSIVAAARVAVAVNRLTQSKIMKIMGWKKNDVDAEVMFQMQRDFIQVTYGKNNNAAVTSGAFLKKDVKEYYNKDKKKISNIFFNEDHTLVMAAEDTARAEEQKIIAEKESVVKSIFIHTKTSTDTGYFKWPLIELARILMEKELSMKALSTILRVEKEAKGKLSDDEIEKDIAKSIANRLEKLFKKPWKHPEHNLQFCFLHKNERIGKGQIVRWLEMKEVEDVEAATEAAIFNNEVDDDSPF